MTKTFYSFL